MEPLILHLYYGLFGSLLEHHRINLGVCILQFRKGSQIFRRVFSKIFRWIELPKKTCV